ncbi:MAG: flagellar hook-basal body complex protein FliE [Planctomycetota bacterium]
MSDPVGLIGGGGLNPARQVAPSAAGARQGGPDFARVLRDNLEQVNEMQADADQAVKDLMTGDRGDLEGVILATEKADNAFRMLQQMRNKVMAAYEEIKQVRV